jgi:hypothetical protein
LIANDKLCERRADATGEIGAFQGGKRIFSASVVFFSLYFDFTQPFLAL